MIRIGVIAFAMIIAFQGFASGKESWIQSSVREGSASGAAIRAVSSILKGTRGPRRSSNNITSRLPHPANNIHLRQGIHPKLTGSSREFTRTGTLNSLR